MVGHDDLRNQAGSRLEFGRYLWCPPPAGGGVTRLRCPRRIRAGISRTGHVALAIGGEDLCLPVQKDLVGDIQPELTHQVLSKLDTDLSCLSLSSRPASTVMAAIHRV